MMVFAAALLAKVTLITLLALGGARLARRQPAAARHVLLSAAFLVLLLLPVAALVIPAIEVAIPVQPRPAAQPARAVAVVGDEASPVAGRSAVRPTGVPAAAAWPSWRALAIGTWMVGTVLFLCPLAAGLSQIRALRRTGRPWRRGQELAATLVPTVRRRVDVLLHEAVPGPMTCGVRRPVILLPRDAPEWNGDDLQRAIVHELEHVRRADWIGHCVARIVCAGYWWHPLVWMAWRRLSLEAERACDDAVVRGAEPTAYADQLIGLAERLSAAHPPALAMAAQRDLAARVRAVLDSRQRRGRAGPRGIALAFAAALLVIATLAPLHVVAAPIAPVQAAATEKFDIVTIKPCAPDAAAVPAGPRGRGAGGGNVSASPGSLHIECMTVQSMIDRAYVFFGEPLLNEYGPPREDTPRVKGGPAWLRTEKYTLEAKAGGAADRRTLMGPMLRAFLEDRLQLKTHRDVEDIPAYAMTVAKGGLKIRPIAADAECKPQCGMVRRDRSESARILDLGGMEREILITVLRLDRHVVDRTGLPESDRYNIHLELPDDPQAQPDDPPAPELFRAVEQQLGLRFEPVKTQHGIIVIDHVERPVPNK